jgi:tRNA pseudouridine55 synthase
MNGWINIYKPKGYTSTYCLNVLKSKFKLKKIGHAGTLDPLAEGILPVAIGEATKSIPYLSETKKTYFLKLPGEKKHLHWMKREKLFIHQILCQIKKV